MNHAYRRLALAAALVAATLIASPATAQDEADPLGEELESYWSPDRSLPVLQQKLHKRDGRFGVGLYAGLMSSEPFYWYMPVGARLSYFLNDFTGIEIGGQYMGNPGDEPGPLTGETEITSFLRTSQEDDFDPTTDLEDRFLWRSNATLVWNPLYGKWSFLNNKLSHFDFNLVLGAGAVSVQRPNVERTTSSVEITPEVVFGGGISFFFGQHWTLRLDGRFYAYQGAESESADTFFKRLQVPSEFLLGTTYLF